MCCELGAANPRPPIYENDLMKSPAPIRREDQRKLTRRKIVDAARACFYERGTADVSMEEVARAAQVGRATLYLHFPNKDSILIELLSQNLAGVQRIFAELCQQERVDIDVVTRWLRGYVEVLRSHREAMRIVRIGIATTDEARAMIHDHHLSLVAMLAARFSGMPQDGPADQARLLLMIARIDFFAGAAAESPSQIDLEAGLSLVGQEIMGLIEGGKGHSRNRPRN